jgi:concentrative nucleoside transporter, CNT family
MMVSVGGTVQQDIAEKNSSSDSLSKERRGVPDRSEDAKAKLNDVTIAVSHKDEPSKSWFLRNRSLVRRLKLSAFAGLLLGWWISATILPATRHRWVVQTFFVWSFIAFIAFRFIPTSVVTRPVEAVWMPLVQKPFFGLSRHVRYGLGWLALLGMILGSAFGSKLENVSFFAPTFFSLEGKCPL